MEQVFRPIPWKVGAWWLAANVMGWPLGMYIAETIPSSVLFVLGGCVIGLAQWVVLARHVRCSAWWLLALGLSWNLGMLAGAYFGFLVIHALWLCGVGGLSAALCQWLVLRRHVDRAWVWVPASVLFSLAGAVAGTNAGWAAYNCGLDDPFAYAVGGSAGGAVIGVPGALVLAWLFSRKAMKEAAPGATAPQRD